MFKLWLKKWLVYAVSNFQQPLQNRVPRVRVLLPLPLNRSHLRSVFVLSAKYKILLFLLMYIKINYDNFIFPLLFSWLFALTKTFPCSIYSCCCPFVVERNTRSNFCNGNKPCAKLRYNLRIEFINTSYHFQKDFLR